MKNITYVLIFFSFATIAAQAAEDKNILTEQDKAELTSIARETQQAAQKLKKMAANKTGRARQALQALSTRYHETAQAIENDIANPKGARVDMDAPVLPHVCSVTGCNDIVA